MGERSKLKDHRFPLTNPIPLRPLLKREGPCFSRWVSFRLVGNGEFEKRGPLLQQVGEFYTTWIVTIQYSLSREFTLLTGSLLLQPDGSRPE